LGADEAYDFHVSFVYNGMVGDITVGGGKDVADGAKLVANGGVWKQTAFGIAGATIGAAYSDDTTAADGTTWDALVTVDGAACDATTKGEKTSTTSKITANCIVKYTCKTGKACLGKFDNGAKDVAELTQAKAEAQRVKKEVKLCHADTAAGAKCAAAASTSTVGLTGFHARLVHQLEGTAKVYWSQEGDNKADDPAVENLLHAFFHDVIIGVKGSAITGWKNTVLADAPYAGIQAIAAKKFKVAVSRRLDEEESADVRSLAAATKARSFTWTWQACPVVWQAAAKTEFVKAAMHSKLDAAVTSAIKAICADGAKCTGGKAAGKATDGYLTAQAPTFKTGSFVSLAVTKAGTKAKPVSGGATNEAWTAAALPADQKEKISGSLKFKADLPDDKKAADMGKDADFKGWVIKTINDALAMTDANAQLPTTAADWTVTVSWARILEEAESRNLADATRDMTVAWECKTAPKNVASLIKAEAGKAAFKTNFETKWKANADCANAAGKTYCTKNNKAPTVASVTTAADSASSSSSTSGATSIGFAAVLGGLFVSLM